MPDAGVGRAVHRRRRARRVGQGHAVPALRQGRRRRRRPRHAARRRGRHAARGRRDLHARGRGRLRRPDGLHRAGRGRPAPHRGADPRRRRRAMSCTCSSATARCSGGTRRSSRSRRRPNLDPAIREAMCADAVRFAARDRLRQRRHRGVPARRRRQLRLHRDEPADPGRAHRDRGGHRRRPGAGADADRVRARRSATSACPRRHDLRGAALQCRITTEDPANGFRPDTGKITTYRSPGGAGVRLDGGTTYTGAEVARTSTRCWPSSPVAAATSDRGGPGPARGGGVPDPWRGHEHPVPAGGARRPRLPRRAAHDVVHRGPPAAAHRPLVGGPRHQAADLPRRHHGEPAARRCAGHRRPGQQAARRST